MMNSHVIKNESDIKNTTNIINVEVSIFKMNKKRKQFRRLKVEDFVPMWVCPIQ